MSRSFENPYFAPQTSTQAAAAMAAESERATFIRRTYVHLGLAILAFAALEVAIFSLVPFETLQAIVLRVSRGLNWLLVLGGFMVVGWVARSWAQSGASPSKQYLGLALYVVAESLLFVPLLFVAQFYVGGQVIQGAAVITFVTFGGLTVVAFLTRVDFSFLRAYLFWGGIVACGAIVCGLLFGLDLGVWFSVAMVALASGYIIYDTSNVLHHYRTDQYVAASLALFASVAVLFFYILRLLMQLSSRD